MPLPPSPIPSTPYNQAKSPIINLVFTTIMGVWCTPEEGSNSLQKVLLAAIKSNEKMRLKESQFKVHLDYMVLV